jgi:hypothetical protein
MEIAQDAGNGLSLAKSCNDFPRNPKGRAGGAPGQTRRFDSGCNWH